MKSPSAYFDSEGQITHSQIVWAGEVYTPEKMCPFYLLVHWVMDITKLYSYTKENKG